MKADKSGLNERLANASIKPSTIKTRELYSRRYAGQMLYSFGIILSVGAICYLAEGTPSLLAMPSKSESDGANSRIPALEAELANIMMDSPTATEDGGESQLARAIISKLMLDNMTQSAIPTIMPDIVNQGEGDLMNLGGEVEPREAFVPESLNSRRVLELLQNLAPSDEVVLGYDQFPVLPSGRQATIKRTANRMNLAIQERLLANRANQPYEFGKRPDTGGISANIFRIGDSLTGVEPVSKFGKRPSAHRYGFGLGKRVTGPNLSRYNFGLGKRASKQIRYDFGLGK